MSEVIALQTQLANYFAGAEFPKAPSWLRALQEQALENFLLRGVPSRHEEQWKYADFSKLPGHLTAQSAQTLNTQTDFSIRMVFVNGVFSKEYSDLSALPSDVICCSLREALSSHESVCKKYLTKELSAADFRFVALNSAFLSDGYFLFVPKGIILPSPIHVIFLNTGSVAHPRNIIVGGVNSQVTVIEEYRSAQAEIYFNNVTTQIELEDGAELNFYKIQNEHQGAAHIANLITEQKRDSTLNTFTLDHGSALTRTDLHVFLQESGAQCDLKGLYSLSNAGQYIDNHVYVNHLAEHGSSSMMYKGILDKKSRAVFNGRVFVEKNAQKINALQANHNLLLSADAEINTKPELEIYADDVKCAHGATIGQLDEDALFYLCSRGIDKATAKKILTHAFAAEVVEQIKDSKMLAYVQKWVNAYAEL